MQRRRLFENDYFFGPYSFLAGQVYSGSNFPQQFLADPKYGWTTDEFAEQTEEQVQTQPLVQAPTPAPVQDQTQPVVQMQTPAAVQDQTQSAVQMSPSMAASFAHIQALHQQFQQIIYEDNNYLPSSDYQKLIQHQAIKISESNNVYFNSSLPFSVEEKKEETKEENNTVINFLELKAKPDFARLRKEKINIDGYEITWDAFFQRTYLHPQTKLPLSREEKMKDVFIKNGKVFFKDIELPQWAPKERRKFSEESVEVPKENKEPQTFVKERSILAQEYVKTERNRGKRYVFEDNGEELFGMTHHQKKVDGRKIVTMQTFVEKNTLVYCDSLHKVGNRTHYKIVDIDTPIQQQGNQFYCGDREVIFLSSRNKVADLAKENTKKMQNVPEKVYGPFDHLTLFANSTTITPAKRPSEAIGTEHSYNSTDNPNKRQKQ